MRSNGVRAWKTIALAMSAAVAVSLTGCAGGDASPGPSGDATTGSNDDSGSAEDYTIALIPGMVNHPAYQTMLCGALDKAEELGVTVDFQGANAWDPTEQIPVVQAVLADNPDALVLVPSDGTALRAPVESFLDAGTPVLTADTGLENSDGLTAVISSDNEQGGGVAAEALGEAIDGEGTVGIISGVPGATTDIARVKGFTDTMKEKFPDVKLLEPEYSRSVVATAESQVESLMLSHSDMTGVFGVNGNSATGAANAVIGSGRDIVVAGYDAGPGAVEQLEKGNINILVVQDFQQEGRLAIQYAYDALTGNDADIETPTVLDNIIATTETADDPDVSKYFYMESCL